ncbi:MAG: sulfatase-like hydrolase/transferase [Sulfitobacter sp.]
MKQPVTFILAAALIFAVLALPNQPDAIAWSALQSFPLELPVILLAMLATGRQWGVPVTLAVLLISATFLKLADIGMLSAYNRTFNPILDAFLIEAGIGLLSYSIGKALAYLTVIGAVVAMVLTFIAILLSLRVWAGLHLPAYGRVSAAVGALAFGGWAVADAGHQLEYWTFEHSPAGTARTSTLMFERGTQMQATAVDLAQFSQSAKQDIYADATGLLDRLDGQDVILIYIESYGRASFDNELYTPTHVGTMTAAAGPISDAGFAMKSGWLTSPTAGGQSWLAHGTLSSGLWTSDSGRYHAMLASDQKSLFHIAQDAGFRTSAVMPAITVAWPESSRMGFEQIFEAADIPYKGDRFNWVTMPDQFTLATYGDLIGDDPRPDFIQIALISSHAPWVPVPDMVQWDAVGDGTIFNEMAARGPTPRELWKNRDDVREAYRKAVNYSLQATFAHVARLGDAAPLIVIVGDHQAAGFVAGSDDRDVPVHMIGPPALVAMIDSWGWTDGLVPAPDAPVRGMDSFRNDFIAAFTTPATVTEVDE